MLSVIDALDGKLICLNISNSLSISPYLFPINTVMVTDMSIALWSFMNKCMPDKAIALFLRQNY